MNELAQKIAIDSLAYLAFLLIHLTGRVQENYFGRLVRRSLPDNASETEKEAYADLTVDAVRRITFGGIITGSVFLALSPIILVRSSSMAFAPIALFPTVLVVYAVVVILPIIPDGRLKIPGRSSGKSTGLWIKNWSGWTIIGMWLFTLFIEIFLFARG